MKRFFPWRVFKLFARNYILLGLFSVTVTYFLTLAFFEIKVFEISNLGILVVPAFLATALGLILAYFSAAPLKSVILKALKIATKKNLETDWDDEEENLLDEEVGEFFELEQALEKIRKKMMKRRLQLAHEREESQVMMGSLEDALVSLDSDGRVSFFNASFAAQFLNITKTQNLKTEAHPMFTDIVRDPELIQAVIQTRKLSEVSRILAQIPTFLYSESRTFSITISPLREEQSKQTYGVMCLFHDITELKMAERIRIEFVENASHELRTPLTSVKGYLDTVQEDIAQNQFEQVPHFLSMISKGVNRLIDLVNDLLTISSLEHQGQLELENIQVEQLTLEVIERMMGLAAQRNISIKTKFNVSQLRGDLPKIEQVLTNLISNAIKYNSANGMVEVIWESQINDGRTALFVRDTGPGISEENLPRLFERFYRVDKGRSRDVGGTGLGLSIVKHIVQAHGGTISVQSVTGKGSEFICFFPDLDQKHGKKLLETADLRQNS